MRTRFGLALIAVLLSTASAPAEGNRYGPEYQQCSGRSSTSEIVECVARLTRTWDRRLNKAYQVIMEQAQPHQRELLRAAQRLWIQYRDANCSWYAAGEGTISRVEAAECLRGMTESRARELQGDQN